MSKASSPQDRVLIRELKVEAILGILLGSASINRCLSTSPCSQTPDALRSKDIVDTVDYAALAGAAAKLTVDGKYLLIETLVEDLAALSLSTTCPGFRSGRKTQAVPAANTIGVEIYRASEAELPMPPIFAFLKVVYQVRLPALGQSRAISRSMTYLCFFGRQIDLSKLRNQCGQLCHEPLAIAVME